MKNKLCLIAILAVIGFLFVACSNGDDGITTVSETTHITVANISITAPAKGAAPATTVSSEEQERFTAGTVTWSPNDSPFRGETIYTATVTLTAKNGFTFTGLIETNAKINGDPTVVTNNTGETVTLSHTFAATGDKEVSSIAIKTPPSNLTYTHGDPLELDGLIVTLTYDNGITEDVAAADFTEKNISTDPAHGIPIERSTYNGKPVTITYGDLTPLATGNLTVSAKSVSDLTVDAIAAQTYTGNAITPAVTVKHSVVTGTTRILVMNTDYTVSYSNNSGPGTATITINGIGDYTGSKVVNFNITAVNTPLIIISIAQPVFDDALVGYSEQWAVESAKNVTIKNEGTGIANITSITLDAAGSAAFTLGGTPITTVAVGGTAAFTVQPKTGLAAGTYEGTITVSYDSGRKAEATVSIKFFRGQISTASTVGMWLDQQSANTIATAYKLIVLYETNSSALSSIADALKRNSAKYVILDLSNSTFTSIEDYAFMSCTNLISITISNRVSSIGNDAFEDCTSLTAINIAADNSAYSSQDGILYNKAKTTLIKYPVGKTGNTFTIPNSVISIEDNAFYGCTSLTSIIIPNSVSSIGENAFSYCTNLTSVNIPNNVSSIGNDAFGECTALTAINIAADNSTYSSQDGVLYNKAKTTLIQYPTGKTGNTFTIPDIKDIADFT